MKQVFIKELLSRIGTSSPAFFKKLKTISLIIALIAAGSLFGLEYDLLNFEGAEKWEEALKAIVAFFSGTFFTSVTTTTEAKLLDDETKGNVLRDQYK